MSDWIRYEWEWEQRPVSIQVDLQYWQLLPTLAYSYLIYVACAPRSSEAEVFSRSEFRFLSEFYQKLDAQLQENAIYVGCVQTECLNQYYFYANDPSLLSAVTSICRTQQRLRTTYGVIHEPQYQTYYRFLFPDDAKLQSVENADFVQKVIDDGGDIDLVRRIGMQMAFPSFEGRESYIRAIPQFGLSVGVTQAIEHPVHPFCVTVNGYSTLHLIDLNRCTSRAIRAAAPYGGILNHLEADFIERH